MVKFVRQLNVCCMALICALASVGCSSKLKVDYKSGGTSAEHSDQGVQQSPDTPSFAIGSIEILETGATKVNWTPPGTATKTILMVAKDPQCLQPVFKVVLEASVTEYDIEIFEEKIYFLCLFSQQDNGTLDPAINNGIEIGRTKNAGESTPSSMDQQLNANMDLRSLDITLDQANVYVNGPASFSARGIYADGSSQNLTSIVAWQSSDADLIKMTSEKGRGEAGADSGTVIVSAGLGEISAALTVDVAVPALTAIEITPTAVSFPNGLQKKFSATGIYADNSRMDVTKLVTWSISNASIAAFVPATPGMLIAKQPGAAVLSAQMGTIKAVTDVTVTSAQLLNVEITPAIGSLGLGASQTFVATGIFTDQSKLDISNSVIWSVSDTNLANISPEGTLSTTNMGSISVKAKMADITATLPISILPAQIESVKVTPTYPSVASGATQAYKAVAKFSDGSTLDVTSAVTWTSSDDSIAVVNHEGIKGLIKSSNQGQGTISALINGISGQAGINVTPAILSQLTVTPNNGLASVGTPTQFTATGLYTDGTSADITNLVTWSSSNTAIATISNASGSEGLANPLTPGVITITASYGAITDNTSFEVTAASLTSISLSPLTPQIAAGTKLNMTATGHYSDGSSRDLTLIATWTSSNSSIAAISNAVGIGGRITGLTAGAAQITATYLGVSNQTSASVSNAQLTSMTMAPVSSTIEDGLTTPFTLTGTFDDATTQDMTYSSTWSTSNFNIATVSNEAGSEGNVQTLEVGTVTITGTYGSISASTTVNVTPGCDGARVGGYCWYETTSTAESCTDFCASHAGYHSATRTFAGNEGTNANCAAVIEAISNSTGVTVSDVSGSQGLGCYRAGSGGYSRITDMVTSPDASGSLRFCACQR